MQINIPTGGYIIKKSIALLCIIKINGYLLIWDNTSAVDTSVITWGNGSTGNFGLVGNGNSITGNNVIQVLENSTKL